MLAVIAWFELLVGFLIAGLWITLLFQQQVPEIGLGRRDIWFHIAAELTTAILLLGAGMNALLTDESCQIALGVAAGALLYTTINSAGYYADRRQHDMVAMFCVLTAATAIAIVVLVAGLNH